MSDGRADVKWSPRVPKAMIRRLYESEAAGLLDGELLDDVGIRLLLRCRDILAVHEARHGRVKCPRCERQGKETTVRRTSRARDELLRCPACSWQITWADYLRTFQHKQLSLGGAGSAFRAFVRQYPRARSARRKMLLVDRLIHEFHYSLRGQPGKPCRAACVNLIQGRLTDVVRFLNELTYGKGAPPELAATRKAWRRQLEAAGKWHPK
jgi:hypothetical protein